MCIRNWLEAWRLRGVNVKWVVRTVVIVLYLELVCKPLHIAWCGTVSPRIRTSALRPWATYTPSLGLGGFLCFLLFQLIP